MIEPLVSDRAVEFDGKIIGHIERLAEGDFHAWNAKHSTLHKTSEAAVAWLTERYAKAQDGE